MTQKTDFSEGVRGGSDGEVQQLIVDERQRQQVTGVVAGTRSPHTERRQEGQRNQITPVKSLHITGLIGKGGDTPRQNQRQDELNTFPRRLRVSRNSSLPLSVKRIHAASDEVNGKSHNARVGLPPKHLYFCDAASYPRSKKRDGDYGKFLYGGTKGFAGRSLCHRSMTARTSTPCTPLAKEGNQRPADLISIATGSISPDGVKGNPLANESCLTDGGEVAVANSLTGNKRDGSLIGTSRRIVYQGKPITRDTEQDGFSKKMRSKEGFCNGRAIASSDPLWKHERENRRPIPNELNEIGHTVVIPQLLKEVPSLPTVLEIAITDHFLASLVVCSQSEMERIVGVLALHHRQEVLQYLRQTYGSHHFLATPLPTSNRAQRAQSPEREEWLSTHRRHLSSTMRSITYNSGPASDMNGVVPSPTKGVRRFLKLFTREVCMAFMDEACAVCAAHRDRVWAEQPQELRSRGMAASGDLVDPLYEQSVTQLLSKMLAWTEKESSRVVATVVRQVKQHVSPCVRLPLAAEEMVS